MNRLLGLAFAISICISSAVRADQEVPLHVAVEKGLVDVQVNGRGSSTGDSVRVTIQRTTPDDVTVVVDPGTVIHSKSRDVQSMSLQGVKYEWDGRAYRKATKIELTDNDKHTFILEGYCRDFSKPTPQTDDAFVVQKPDQGDTNVLVAAKRLGVTVKVTQAALWLQRSRLSDEELSRRFQIDSDELAAARQVLVAVNTPSRSVDVQTTVERLLARIAERNPRDADGLRRGDTVAVTSAAAKLTQRRGQQVLARLDKDTNLEVIRVAGDDVVVLAEIDGKKQRGLVKLSDVKLLRSATRPAPERLRDAAREVQLEVFDKLNIDIQRD